jgi:mitochondrial fission protein ELM1
VIGVLIGGTDQNYTISVSWAEKLLGELETLKEKYCFIITTSRRTEEKVISFIREKITGDNAFIYTEFPGYSETTNYPGILSLCNYLFVTEDSINMVSEAASSGRPVLILGVDRKNKRKQLVFAETLEKLVDKGYAEYLSADKMSALAEKTQEIQNKNLNKLNETEKCARKILQNVK